MNIKSPIPVSRDRSLAARDVHPFATLQQEIDRLFDGFSRNFSLYSSNALVPSMDVAETDKEIEVTAELPGLEEKDVQLNVIDNLLTIRGEKKTQREEKEKNYHLLERSYGSFTRSIELPKGTNIDAIKATMTNGVLKVTVPKPASAQARRIDVRSAV